MTDDRRREKRISTNLPAKWTGHAGRHEARIEDISVAGCFVNTTGRVDPGELIMLEIKMPSGQWLQLRGETTSFQQGVGFGLLFAVLTDKQKQALRELLD
ncbi:MAG: PilZ domain-containing protein [Pyrinomonadaceae bacterium]